MNWLMRLARYFWPLDLCKDGLNHEWQEYAGTGAAGFESGLYCHRCGAKR